MLSPSQRRPISTTVPYSHPPSIPNTTTQTNPNAHYHGLILVCVLRMTCRKKRQTKPPTVFARILSTTQPVGRTSNFTYIATHVPLSELILQKRHEAQELLQRARPDTGECHEEEATRHSQSEGLADDDGSRWETNASVSQW